MVGSQRWFEVLSGTKFPNPLSFCLILTFLCFGLLFFLFELENMVHKTMVHRGDRIMAEPAHQKPSTVQNSSQTSNKEKNIECRGRAKEGARTSAPGLLS